MKLVTGRAKILLMDDEQTIGDLAKEMLSMLGYEVDVANEGSQAVKLYQKAWKTSVTLRSPDFGPDSAGGDGRKRSH